MSGRRPFASVRLLRTVAVVALAVGAGCGGGPTDGAPPDGSVPAGSTAGSGRAAPAEGGTATPPDLGQPGAPGPAASIPTPEEIRSQASSSAQVLPLDEVMPPAVERAEQAAADGSAARFDLRVEASVVGGRLQVAVHNDGPGNSPRVPVAIHVTTADGQPAAVGGTFGRLGSCAAVEGGALYCAGETTVIGAGESLTANIPVTGAAGRATVTLDWARDARSQPAGAVVDRQEGNDSAEVAW